MRLGFAIICFAFLSKVEVGSAAPLDCRNLLHTKVPFEFTKHSSDGDIQVQAYRSDNNFATSFVKSKTGKVFKFIRQSIFLMSRSSDDLSMNFKYNYVETDSNAFSYKPKFYDQTVQLKKNSEEKPFYPGNGRFYLEWLGNESLSIGPCVVNVVRFSKQKQASSWPFKDNPKNEFWFSPDLIQNLRTIIRSKDKDGNEKQVDMTVTSISIDFEPIKP